MARINSQIRGSLEIAVASMGFGFLGIFGKWAFSAGASVGEVLTYRFGCAALIIWISLLIIKPQWVILPRRQIFVAALLGIFGYAFFSTLYFEAIEGLSVTLAALLLYTYPFWVSVFSHLFTQDKVTWREGLCMTGATIGLMLLLWGSIEIRNFWSILAGLGSAISYAVYVILSGRLQKNVRPVSSTVYVITFAFLALAIFHHPNPIHIADMPSSAAGSILGLSLICTIMPLILELSALQKIKSKEVALLMMIEPLTAALLGSLILHENLSGRQVVGAIIIALSLIANSLLLNASHRPSSRLDSPT
jgi:drug/metabolite transporter (DMT)-like permease